jgi:hypothetical protein
MHASTEQLIALRDGRPVAVEAAAHAHTCAECSRALVRLTQWRQRLRSLPGFAAPESAWQAIGARLDESPEPQRRRHRVPVVGTALAASLVVAVVLVTWQRRAPPPPVAAGAVTASPALAQLQSQSRYLEQVVQTMNAGGDQGVTNAGTAATVAALEDRIALLDYAINRANTGPQPPRNLTALWQQRVDLLQSLAAVRYTQVTATAWGS